MLTNEDSDETFETDGESECESDDAPPMAGKMTEKDPEYEIDGCKCIDGCEASCPCLKFGIKFCDSTDVKAEIRLISSSIPHVGKGCNYEKDSLCACSSCKNIFNGLDHFFGDVQCIANACFTMWLTKHERTTGNEMKSINRNNLRERIMRCER